MGFTLKRPSFQNAWLVLFSQKLAFSACFLLFLALFFCLLRLSSSRILPVNPTPLLLWDLLWELTLSDMTEWFAGQFTGSILRYDDQAPLVLYEHVQCGNDISEGKLLCPFLPVKRQETYDMAHPNTASPTSETGASSSPARIL